MIGAVVAAVSSVSTTHEVRMTGRFIPAETSAQPGDTLRFINQSGGPHNIQFFADSMPEAARRLLEQEMRATEKIVPVSRQMPVLENDRDERAVRALPPGRYPFVCLPHHGSRMLGALIVVR